MEYPMSFFNRFFGGYQQAVSKAYQAQGGGFRGAYAASAATVKRVCGAAGCYLMRCANGVCEKFPIVKGLYQACPTCPQQVVEAVKVGGRFLPVAAAAALLMQATPSQGLQGSAQNPANLYQSTQSSQANSSDAYFGLAADQFASAGHASGAVNPVCTSGNCPGVGVCNTPECIAARQRQAAFSNSPCAGGNCPGVGVCMTPECIAARQRAAQQAAINQQLRMRASLMQPNGPSGGLNYQNDTFQGATGNNFQTQAQMYGMPIGG